MAMCAIHQPNFFPWLGYFDKIRQADAFVFLDQVDYPKSGSSMQSWCNRVKLNISGTAKWVSCPVIRESGPQPIDTVLLNNTRPWRDELRTVLTINYKRAPNFPDAYAMIDRLLDFETEHLAAFNINAVTAITRLMGFTGALVRQSSLTLPNTSGTDRLISICQMVGADSYLTGGGAAGYQEDERFAAAGIHVTYQHFVPEPYGDPTRFVAGLSVIDWLMCADDARPGLARFGSDRG